MGFDTDLLIIWGGILLVVFTVSFFTYMNRRNRYRLLEKLAEKGPLSPELLAGLTNGKTRSDNDERHPIRSGIYLMCIGTAIALFFWAMQGGGIPLDHGNWLMVVGAFPFMIGLARVLGASFDKREDK